MREGALVSGRFSLESEVGAGGGGRVFRARDQVDGAVVAVKCMSQLDARGLARFTREAVLLARLSHPGLLRYLAHGTAEDGTPWLATEWLEGEDLRRHLSRRTSVRRFSPSEATLASLDQTPDGIQAASGRLPGREVLSLLRRVAAALAALHGEGLLHRDIKPSNVFLVNGLASQAKVIDLGTARAALGPGDLTRPGHLVGTPSYMAPEQARGGAELTPAVDVWALGCVAYECLSGVPPFRGGDVGDTLSRIQHEEPSSLFALGLDAPELLLGLVHRMLSKHPRGRPADGAALVEELEVIGAVCGGEAAPLEAALGEAERRIGCSLWAEPRVEPVDARAFAALVVAAGFRASVRSDGRAVVRMPATETLTDQAHRGARLALQLRVSAGGWGFVLATGASSLLEVGGDAEPASALLERVSPGEVLVDARTVSLLEHRYGVEAAGDAYRLARALEAEVPRTLLGRPTRTVGRRRELAMLDATWLECADEPRARVVLVTAAPGLGKSRLRWEFVRSLRSRRDPHLLLSLRGDSTSAGSPFSLIGPALCHAFELSTDDEPDLARSKVHAMVRRSLGDTPEARSVATFLVELTGVRLDDPGDEALRAARTDPMLLSERMSAAFVAWLEAEARQRPVLVVVEDLHWGDRTSVAFLDAALRALRDAPVMVLSLARPEVHDVFPSLWASHSPHEIRLESLGKKASVELAREVLGGEASEADLEALGERAAGNALYLEELLRAMVQDGVAAAVALPDTVVGMVQSRMASMGPEARRILRAASVFGESFWEGGVRTLVGEGGGTFSLADWLSELARRELVSRVRESRVPGDVEYRFRHALVRDSAYALLTNDDRAKAHRMAAEWLEQRGERDAHRLATHYELGGAQSDALRCFSRAAELALEGNDLESALASVERARACGAQGAALGTLHALSAAARYWQSRYRDAADDGLAALEQSPPGTSQWFQACGTTLVSLARLGDMGAFERTFGLVTAVSAHAGAESAELVALCRGAFQLVFHGRFADADRTLARIAVLSRASSLDALSRAQASHVRGVRAAMVGDVGIFLEHLEAAVAAFDEAGDVRNVALERTTVGWCHAELGRYAEAVERIRHNLEHCRSIKAQQAITYAAVNLGYALERASSEPHEADRVLRGAVGETASVRNQRLEGWARGHLASLWLRHGDAVVAEREAREACALLTISPSLHGWVLALWARAELRLGRLPQAYDLARQSMAVLERVGGLLQGSSLPPLALIEVLAARGEHAEARRVAERARERLHERARSLPEPAWRTTFLAIEEHEATLAWCDKLRDAG